MKNELHISDLPSHVRANQTEVGSLHRGRGVFDVSDMNTDVCAVIGAYLHTHQDGSTTPCFIVQTPKGHHINIAVTKVRYVGPAERGELFRSGVAVNGINEAGR